MIAPESKNTNARKISYLRDGICDVYSSTSCLPVTAFVNVSVTTQTYSPEEVCSSQRLLQPLVE